MNPSADEEVLSAAEVPEINQVTVATVTTTSTINTQTVAGTGDVIYLYLLVMLHNKPYQTIVTRHLVTSKVLLIIKNTPLTF